MIQSDKMKKKKEKVKKKKRADFLVRQQKLKTTGTV